MGEIATALREQFHNITVRGTTQEKRETLPQLLCLYNGNSYIGQLHLGIPLVPEMRGASVFTLCMCVCLFSVCYIFITPCKSANYGWISNYKVSTTEVFDEMLKSIKSKCLRIKNFTKKNLLKFFLHNLEATFDYACIILIYSLGS